MGGMIAQELALLLLPQGRLLSLGLTVTCRGLKPLGGLLSPFFIPQVGELLLACRLHCFASMFLCWPRAARFRAV
jgi:hypothetical protein